MYERTYGYKYDGGRDVAVDAKMIRADIKTLVAAGMLPADWKYGVRISRYSMGQSLTVTATSPRPVRLMDCGSVATAPGKDRVVTLPVEGRFVSCVIRAGQRWDVRPCDVTTTQAGTVRDALADLVAAYNHDGSDTITDYFDVKFYGHVTVTTAAGVRESERDRPSYLPWSCAVGLGS